MSMYIHENETYRYVETKETSNTVYSVYGGPVTIPDGWDYVGFRELRKGEHFISRVTHDIAIFPADKDFAKDNPYVIVKKSNKIPNHHVSVSIKDIYGTVPEIPDGYEYVDFRVVDKERDRGLYFIPTDNLFLPISTHNIFIGKVRIILRKV